MKYANNITFIHLYLFMVAVHASAHARVCGVRTCMRACVGARSLNVLMSCSSIGGLNRDSVVLNNVLRHEPTLDKWIKVANMNKSRARQGESASETR